MLILFSGLALFVISIAVFIQHPKFGRISSGIRKKRINQSVHFNNGKFQNINPTPQLTDGATYFSLFLKFFNKQKVHIRPINEIKQVKTDLHQLKTDEDVLVWFGHSSYYIQLDGKRFLIDPVFSEAASPVSFINRPFKASNSYSVDDIPAIDYLIITHDHWDHLDYPTVLGLKNKVKTIICTLGVGSHFEHWGFDLSTVLEMEWNQHEVLESDFKITCLPARHFSGRGIRPNQSLWGSFLLEAPSMTIYMGGDSGYDSHFAEIGNRFEKIDLAILEAGQYNHSWKYIHMMPHEVIQATKDLKASRLLPVHNSKFALAQHEWNEPLKAVHAESKEEDFSLLNPMIGEVVLLKEENQDFSVWYENN